MRCSLLVLTTVALAFVLGCGARVSPNRAPHAFTLSLDGYRLQGSCWGLGSPTVVLDHGMGLDATSWRDVVEQLARTTKVCTYDRAGAGASSAPRRPRSCDALLADLRVVVDRVSPRAPVVLVGHSFGGLLGRIFASARPDRLAGLVLVEPADPDFAVRFVRDVLSRATATDATTAYRTMIEDEVARNPEQVDWETCARAARAVTTLGDLPLVVLAKDQPWGGYPKGYPPHLIREEDELWRSLLQRQAALSRHGRFEIVAGSGHLVPRDQPRRVIEVIVKLVGELRQR